MVPCPSLRVRAFEQVRTLNTSCSIPIGTSHSSIPSLYSLYLVLPLPLFLYDIPRILKSFFFLLLTDQLTKLQ